MNSTRLVLDAGNRRKKRQAPLNILPVSHSPIRGSFDVWVLSPQRVSGSGHASSRSVRRWINPAPTCTQSQRRTSHRPYAKLPAHVRRRTWNNIAVQVGATSERFPQRHRSFLFDVRCRVPREKAGARGDLSPRGQGRGSFRIVSYTGGYTASEAQAREGESLCSRSM